MSAWTRSGWLAAASAIAAAAATEAAADAFTLNPVMVEAAAEHPSQTVRTQVQEAFTQSRTSSEAGGAALQNINPVNSRDALRYNSIGTISGPGAGSRFGGPSSIRTFGDFSAATSIDGLPAFKAAGEEGGGYGNTLIPSIAIDRITVQKGGRGVGFGDGSDGGVFETTIKSGRGYDDHRGVSIDLNTANELLTQAEVADSAAKWDYYIAGSFLEGRYDGEPPELDHQRVFAGLAKVGVNFGDDTRAEFLAIGNRNRPDIVRNGVVEDIGTESFVFAGTVDARLSETTALRFGHQYTDTSSEWQARLRDRSIDTHISFADAFYSAPLTDSVRYDGSVGAEYKRTNYLRDRIYDLVFHDVSVRNTNVLTFDDNLALSLGLRHVWFENDLVLRGAGQPDNLADDTLLAHEVGAAYSILPGTRVRASAASGYNRFYEKYGNFGNDALNPAGAGDDIVESETLEVGIKQSWSGGWADLAVYNIVQDNVPRRNGGAIQNVEVEQSGVELEAQHRFFDRLTVSAGYMYIFDVKATRDDGTDAGGNVFFGANGVPVPTHQALLRSECSLSPQWLVWGVGYYNSGYERDNFGIVDNETNDYYRVDLGVAWLPREDVTLRFRIENIFDEKDFGQTLEGAPVADADNIGRVFWVGLDYTF